VTPDHILSFLIYVRHSLFYFYVINFLTSVTLLDGTQEANLNQMPKKKAMEIIRLHATLIVVGTSVYLLQTLSWASLRQKLHWELMITKAKKCFVALAGKSTWQYLSSYR
jgi:hypothetical protein